jgi:hypothetical protein
MTPEQRADLVDSVERELWRMDAEPLYAIALISGISVECLRDLGGLE